MVIYTNADVYPIKMVYILPSSYMVISTNAYIIVDNPHGYICLNEAIYQVIYTQTHYLGRVCGAGGFTHLQQ